MDTLVAYAVVYKKYYEQEQKPIFHVACSCVVSQQVAFNVGRTIRKQLYELCGFPLTRDRILNADLSNIANLTPDRIALLKNIADIDDTRDNNKVLVDYNKLKGFGKWTFDAVSILLNLNDTVNLSTDSYIRRNLAIYLNKPKLTEKEAHNYLLQAKNDQTKVCYLLWRLKPTSVCKIISEQVLLSSDFV